MTDNWIKVLIPPQPAEKIMKTMMEDNMAALLSNMSLSLAMMIRKPGGLRKSLHRLTVEQ